MTRDELQALMNRLSAQRPSDPVWQACMKAPIDTRPDSRAERAAARAAADDGEFLTAEEITASLTR